MKKSIFIILILCISLLDAKYLAFLISTEDGAPLYTDKDVATMKKLLGDKYEYIILHKKDATYHNVRDKFIKISKMLNSDDTFVFYYSGHGARFDNLSSNRLLVKLTSNPSYSYQN